MVRSPAAQRFDVDRIIATTQMYTRVIDNDGDDVRGMLLKVEGVDHDTGEPSSVVISLADDDVTQAATGIVIALARSSYNEELAAAVWQHMLNVRLN